ncbi:MAG: fermentation-respiration switch protein FrsA (DUF1100 family) [Candidatus Omnitrophota bacterium]|jgi:fermentation-respiration switch protein FrsA (DUF1100 family)
MTTLFLVFIAIVSILFIGIRFIEARSLYFPTRIIESKPDVLNLNYKEVWLKASDLVKIHAWYFGQGQKPVLIYCHGNGGNMGLRITKIKFFLDIGFDVLAFDYRGYGQSDGKPSEKGLYADAVAAYDYLHAQMGYPAEKIALYGESLGGAVAAELAIRKKIAYLIIEDSFTSIPDMAKQFYPWLPDWCLLTKFASVLKMGKVLSPVLIYHSKDDEIIPFHMGRSLYDNAKEPKDFVELRGSHNTAYFDSGTLWANKLKEVIKHIN